MQRLTLLTLTTALIVCSGLANAQTSGGFIARLGNDTTFIERYTRTGNVIEGDMVSKFPRGTRLHYLVTLGPQGTVIAASHVVRGITAAADAPALFERTVTIADSIVTTEIRRGGKVDTTNSGRLVVAMGSIPWIANSMAMFEQQIRQARGTKGDSIPIETFTWGPTGRQSNYVKKLSATEMEAQYSGNPVRIRIDADGLIQQYDGIASTSKLLATRTPNADLESFAKKLAAAESAGAVPGVLSPRDTVRLTVAGAQLQLDYGRPKRRGRKIWGEVVPWNHVWRTGANAATQFSCTKDLQFGSTTVPAGKYTLWTIPTATGATLIINKQTGQWGTVYDSKEDLAHVSMRKEQVATLVDQFTITMKADASGAALSMVWEDTQLSIPFSIK